MGFGIPKKESLWGFGIQVQGFMGPEILIECLKISYRSLMAPLWASSSMKRAGRHGMCLPGMGGERRV